MSIAEAAPMAKSPALRGIWLVWLAIIVNTLIFLDPSDTNFGLGFGISYLPFLLFGAVLLLRPPTSIRFSSVDLAILIFLLIPVLGGVWFFDNIAGEHFFRLSGLGMIYFVAKLLFLNNEFYYRVIGFLHSALLTAGILLVAMLVLWRLGLLTQINEHNQNLFHEEVFLLVCLPFLPVSTLNRQRLLLVIAVLGCVLTLKNTGFILAALVCVLYFVTTTKRFAWVEIGAKLFILAGLVLVISAIATVFFAEHLPNGNIATRSITYGLRLDQFFNAPVFGRFFDIKTTIDVGWGRVSSHSDILDILAGMGIVGFMLLAIPVVILLGIKLPNTGRDLLPFKILVIGFLSVATLNPIMMTPKLVFFFWLSLGVLAAQAAKPQVTV